MAPIDLQGVFSIGLAVSPDRGAGADPVKAGLVKSLARPGGNLTGLTDSNRELSGKRLELLKEAVPKLAHVAILYERSNPANAFEIKEALPPVARSLKLTLQPTEVPSIEDLDQFLPQ